MNASAKQPEHTIEQELIILCSQTEISSKQAGRVSAILNQDLDWNYISKISGRNAVLSLVNWNLLTKFSSKVPSEIAKSLKADLDINTRRNMLMSGKLLELIKAFEAQGIPMIPFKGPLLAYQAHRHLALRQFGDLDILIPPKYLNDSIELLKSCNYKPLNSVNWIYKTDLLISRVKDICFSNETGSVRLELHWKLSGSHFSLPFEINRLWENPAVFSFAGVKTRTLPINLLLIYLCVHGSRHAWERLGWISDVNELIRSQTQIDWKSLYAEAAQAGCENTLTLGLYLAHDFFGLQLPEFQLKKITKDKIYAEIAEQVKQRLFQPEMSNLEIGNRYAYHLKLKEKSTDRMKLHAHYLFWYVCILFRPNAKDKSVFGFPKWLAPLYYVARPLRLIFDYTSRSGKINSSELKKGE